MRQEKTIDTLLIIFSIFLLILLMLIAVKVMSIQEQEISLLEKKMNESRIVSQDYLISPKEIRKIKEIAYWNAQEEEYELHVYDCTQFSENLVKKLKAEGYEAQCTAGNNWAFDYTNHTWVSVWINGVRLEIESTTGELLTTEKYKTYEVKWEGRCW